MTPDEAIRNNNATPGLSIFSGINVGDRIRNKHGEEYVALSCDGVHVKAWQKSTGGDSAFVHVRDWAKGEPVATH